MKTLFILILLTGSLTNGFSQDSSMEQAYTLLSDGYLEEALNMFNELEKNNASNSEFYFLRGSCLSELGENNKAITDLSISISLDNTNADAYYQRGFTQFTVGNSEQALSDFNQAIQISPDYGEAYLNRGTVYYDLEKMAEACQDWQSALNAGVSVAQSLIDQLCKD